RVRLAVEHGIDLAAVAVGHGRSLPVSTGAPVLKSAVQSFDGEQAETCVGAAGMTLRGGRRHPHNLTSSRRRPGSPQVSTFSTSAGSSCEDRNAANLATALIGKR